MLSLPPRPLLLSRCNTRCMRVPTHCCDNRDKLDDNAIRRSVRDGAARERGRKVVLLKRKEHRRRNREAGEGMYIRDTIERVVISRRPLIFFCLLSAIPPRIFPIGNRAPLREIPDDDAVCSALPRGFFFPGAFIKPNHRHAFISLLQKKCIQVQPSCLYIWRPNLRIEKKKCDNGKSELLPARNICCADNL